MTQLDPHTDEHYPWILVSKEKFEEILDLHVRVFEMSISESTEEKRGRHNWWGVGYRVEATGEYYVHPMNMSAEDLVDFDPLPGYEYLKEGSILHKILKVTDAPDMTPRQILDLVLKKV